MRHTTRFVFSIWFLSFAGCGGDGDAAQLEITGEHLEGATLTFRVIGASGSAPLTYVWDFGDGTAADEGTGTSSHIYADDGTFEVSVVGTREDGSVERTSASVVVENVAPTFRVEESASALPGTAFTLVAQGFEDPGALDRHEATLAWGDGTESQVVDLGRGASGDLRFDHRFDEEGDYTVALTIRDDDGGETSASMMVAVTLEQRIFLAFELMPWVPVNDEVFGLVTATDVFGRELTLSLVEAPEGMTFDAAEGELSWFPAAADVGSHRVVVRGTDGEVSAEAEATLVVSDVDVQASEMITAVGGGVVEVSDPASPLMGARLEIPAGALSEDTEIGIGIAVTPPEEGEAPTLGAVVELLPSGTVFSSPVTLTLPYDPSEIDPGFADSELSIQQYLTYGIPAAHAKYLWLPVEESVASDDGTVEAQLEHFSTYRVSHFRWGNAATYETDHTEIHYYLSPGIYGDPVPLPDDEYEASGLAPEYRPEVPNYIEDLAFFLETARQRYLDAGYDLPSKISVEVREGKAPSTPDFNGTLGLFEDLIIDNRMHTETDRAPESIRRNLMRTAAHELFHLAQRRTLITLIGSIALHFPRIAWIFEATATWAELFVFPFEADEFGHPFTRAQFLLKNELHLDGCDGRCAVVFFEYMEKRHPETDLVATLFAGDDPAAGDTAALLAQGARDWLYEELAEAGTDERLWLDYAFGFQYLRDDEWVDGVTHMGLTSYSVNRPSGREERDDPLAANPFMWGVRGGPVSLPRGSVVSYIIGLEQLFADPTLTPDEMSVVLEPSVTGALGSLYLHRPGETPELLMPELTDDGARVRVSNVGPDGRLVASFWNPDTAEENATTELSVYFESAVAFRSIAGGFRGFCGIDGAGTAYCWGRGESNVNITMPELSTAHYLGVSGPDVCVSVGPMHIQQERCARTPTPIESIESFASIAFGQTHGCAITVDGRAFCWGNNERGQIGNGTFGVFEEENVPVQVVTDNRYTDISVGVDTYGGHSCAVNRDGQVLCWGNSTQGQVGRTGSAFSAPLLVPLPPAERFVSVSAGRHASCAVTDDDDVFCWGFTASGTLPPTRVGIGYRQVVVSSAASGHACFLADDGVLSCGGNLDPTAATPVAGAPAFASVSQSRWGSMCGITDLGQLFCWGANSRGQVGNGRIEPTIEPPTAVLEGELVTEVAVGSENACAITMEGAAFCWGFGAYGALGGPAPECAEELCWPPYFTDCTCSGSPVPVTR